MTASMSLSVFDMHDCSCPIVPMKINQFFEETLQVKLKNPQWSWGAFDRFTNRVFLRVWNDDINDGHSVVQIARKVPLRQSHGYPERMKHIELIKDGAEGFGIVCKPVDPNTVGTRKIAQFDEHYVLRLGEITEDSDNYYGRIEEHVPIMSVVCSATAQATLWRDIEELNSRKGLAPTVKAALVNARIGQGAFRSGVLRQWGSRCAVSQCRIRDVIRASHIKPWRDANDSERLDIFNGLPLIASYDALFDCGLISFDDSGCMLTSQRLSMEERTLFTLDGRSLTISPPKKTAEYLAYHRAKIFIP